MDGDWEVAGWTEFDGDWQDVENGGTPLDFDDVEPWDVDQITVHYTNKHGDDIYFTILGPWDDWDDIEDFIDEALDRYGVE